MEYAQKLADEFTEQINQYYRVASSYHDQEILRQFYENKLRNLERGIQRNDPDIVTFAVSGTDKCSLEVWYKHKGAPKDEITKEPFQGRWQRNGSAVIEFLQIDMLHFERVLGDNAKFVLERLPDGSPAFEDNMFTRLQLQVSGVPFILQGKPDGILIYKPDNVRIGFEYKTKQSGLHNINPFKLKAPEHHHFSQLVASSILFGCDIWLIMYESLQKPSWHDGPDAKPDFLVLPVVVTEEDKMRLLFRLARQAQYVYENERPRIDPDKCVFCEYKTHCAQNITKEEWQWLVEVEKRFRLNERFNGQQEHRNILAFMERVREVNANIRTQEQA